MRLWEQAIFPARGHAFLAAGVLRFVIPKPEMQDSVQQTELQN